ncbi:hypothetical protein GCM10014715_78740 [Streptomyces spiralis]|uniref:Uncharacterized protein n=1 Tax=Streptomyces spiralis TaxID=66376 RepID=A0A919E3W6_9ACTN|nr:hypothetical protein GCM10014715_78740 [Streptomyces spiralis]
MVATDSLHLTSERLRFIWWHRLHGQGGALATLLTLQVALLDLAAAEKWASGRLVKALAPPMGFTAAVAAVNETSARPAAAPHRARAEGPSSKPGRPDAALAGKASRRRRRRE